MKDRFENKIIEVCSKCNMASCWHGIFYCNESKIAGTEFMTVKELRKFDLENECYWSDEHLTKVFGDAAPNGYRD